MANTLVSAGDLLPFPGAPHDVVLVDVAAASVRAEAGWHIAPEVTETLTVTSYGGAILRLPTRRLVSVAAVRDVTTGSTVLTGWKLRETSLYRASGWPVGKVEVDLTHGYAEAPAELLPILAARIQAATDPRDLAVASESTTRGPFSESRTYRAGATDLDPAIARYALPAGIA